MRNRSRWTMSRRFKLGWALRQHTAEIVPSGLTRQVTRSVLDTHPGARCFMRRASFSRSEGLAAVNLLVGAPAE